MKIIMQNQNFYLGLLIFMQILRQNMITLYGQEGQNWISQLSLQIEELQLLWGLKDLQPFPNLSYNYVCSGFKNHVPIVLKLSFNEKDLKREATALKSFQNYGVISILDQKPHALLLQKAINGHSLKLSLTKEAAITVACQVIRQLQKAPCPEKELFPHIKEQLSDLDKVWDLSEKHLETARNLKNNLLTKTYASQVLLHGDLHQGNILSHGQNWLAIDPKGVIGFPINEFWASVEHPDDLKFIADYFHYPLKEVIQWYYVHLILAACWQIEDHLDPTLYLTLAQKVNSLI